MLSDKVLDNLPHEIRRRIEPYVEAVQLMTATKNAKVLKSMAPSGVRGLILQRGKQGVPTKMPSNHEVYFDWTYPNDQPEMRELYTRAKEQQWNGDDLPWHIDVDPENPEKPIIPRHFMDYDALRAKGHQAHRPRGTAAQLERRLLDAESVLARRARRAFRSGPGDRSGAVLRRQALRGDPGRRRRPPRRGVPPLPRLQDEQALPDQRQPLRDHRRPHPGLPMGREVLGHADHGRGPGPRCVRNAVSDDRGADAQAAAEDGHPGRGPARALRGASPCATISGRS